MKEIKVYIASPYTLGWMPKMVRLQLEAADKLMDLGYIPYTPLLAHFQEIYNPRTEHDWLRVDFTFLKTCDAVLRLKPLDRKSKEIISSGADKECLLAKENDIPVFYSVEELNDHFKAGAVQSSIPYLIEKFTAHRQV